MATGLLQLLGGAVLSVLPVGIYPFEPEQSLSHYSVHVLYGVLQVPLLLVATRAITSPTTTVTTRSASPPAAEPLPDPSDVRDQDGPRVV